MTQAPCPCGSGQTLAQCCQPFIQGKAEPKTAEQLLRARYTAFTQSNADYVLSTHHSKTRDQVNRQEILDWAKGSVWQKLEIVQKEAGEAKDEQGTIIFHAYYQADGKDQDHFEKSHFEKEDGKWRFLDAQGVYTGPYVRTEPKIGRNDPCPCGSGKKNKKCCAA